MLPGQMAKFSLQYHGRLVFLALKLFVQSGTMHIDIIHMDENKILYIWMEIRYYTYGWKYSFCKQIKINQPAISYSARVNVGNKDHTYALV